MQDKTNPATRSRAIDSIMREYELAIQAQMNKIPLEEDIKALSANSSELVREMFKEREYPRGYAYHTSHNVSVESFLLPKNGVGYIIPRSNLPPAYRMMYMHLQRDWKRVDYVYFGPSAGICFHHSLGYCKYKQLPFEDIFIHKINTNKLDQLMVERTGWAGVLRSMFRYKGEIKIEEVYAFRAGSRGNFSDKMLV
jgi:hypothetical protein